MSGTAKTAAFVELRSALYSGDLALPADPELLRELRALCRRITPGAAAVEWPGTGSSHGDRAQALALAVGEHVRQGAPSLHTRLTLGRGGTMTGGLLTREL